MKKLGHGEHVDNQIGMETGSEELHPCKQCLAGVLILEIHPFGRFGLNYFFLKKSRSSGTTGQEFGEVSVKSVN